MKRSPLKRYGARAQRRAESRAAFRIAVLGRAQGLCERCGQKRALDPHHVLPVSRGGLDEPENGRALCRACHDGAHSHTLDDWRDWIHTRKAP